VTVTSVSTAFQSVSYAAPTVTQGAPPVTTTCSPASGASFPLGTTPVSCAANDAMSRRATCSFNVTLKGLKLGATKYEAFGDSFTEGENGRRPVLDIPNAYPTKLQAAFDATYPNQGITVLNRGVSGEPVETTVDKIRMLLPADRPDAVLLLTGYNNLLGSCKVIQDQNPLCSNAIKAVDIGVQDAIRKIKESPVPKAYIFVSTLTPSGPLVPPTNPDDRRLRKDAIEQTNQRIRNAVAAGGAILVDIYPLFVGHEAEYIDNDGLHPRPAGSQVIADTFFAAIQRTIPQTPLFGFTSPR
jgi:lysophospholipase L1-like esterase